MRLIAVPTHEPCGREGLGVVADDNALTCTVRRRWREGGDHERYEALRWAGLVADDEQGCGLRIEMCIHGLHACVACHREAA